MNCKFAGRIDPWTGSCVLFLVWALGFPLNAEEANEDAPDFGSMSLEELMRYPVTSVTRHEQSLSSSPAAIHVITQEDVRRSGVTSIPEALRMAPGLAVARMDSHTWAVSARGFNDVFANKLLVLQDGRSIYTPLFSGVFWDVQDTLLEDLDRIEVIRGPGATLWGANAVNGVINIITKPADQTQGWLVSGGTGTEEKLFGGVRYGGKINDQMHFRVYGKYFDRDDMALANGADAQDGWRMGRGGFRMDWQASDQNHFTFQGEMYAGRLEQIYTNASPIPVTLFPPSFIGPSPDRIHVNGQNVLARWTRSLASDSELKAQTYYDRTFRDAGIVREHRNTYDLDLQYRLPTWSKQRVTVGGGYRVLFDDVDGTFTAMLTPEKRTTDLFSAFVQDEIELIEDKLTLTIGSKFEHNDYTGFEVQPSGRLAWTPTEWQTLWGSVSRAVRTPSRAEDDVVLHQPVSPFVISQFLGSRRFDSEKLLAYELGYRLQPHRRMTFDVALFFNDYDDLRSAEMIGLSPGPPVTARTLIDNKMVAETYGVEFSPSFQVTDWWRVIGSYTFLQMDVHTGRGSTDTSADLFEGRDPQHQFSIRSLLDLPWNLQFDSTLRYVDSLPSIAIPSYLALDLRLGWRPTRQLDISLVAQNLFDNRHPEFFPSTIRTQATEVEHSVYGKITWRF